MAGAAEYTDCTSAEGLDSLGERSGYDTKQSDGEAPVMQELWGMCNTPSLPLLLGSLLPGVVAPDPIYPTPPLGQDMTQGQFLSGV